MNLRHSVRALVLDEQDRVLLCRYVVPRPAGTRIWVTPGGGIEPGESCLEALRRELREEVGLVLDADPPHVWRQEVRSGHIPGYDGVRNDFFLVRVASFEPPDASRSYELVVENIDAVRWWGLQEVAGYRGPDLFSPRDLATPLEALIASGVPDRPTQIGR